MAFAIRAASMRAMPPKVWYGALLALGLLAACTDVDTLGVLSRPVVGPVVDVSEDGTTGQVRSFVLHADLRARVCNDDNQCDEIGDADNPLSYRASVYCNGAHARVFGVSRLDAGRLRISIDERPSGSVCSFRIVRIGTNTGGVGAERVEPITPPLYEIHGARDAGASGGRHWFELYGRFPSTGAYASARCNGSTYTVRVEYSSTGQVNVSVPPIGLPASCAFAVGGGPSRVSPYFAVRTSGVVPRLAGFLGAYAWGGYQPGYPHGQDVLAPAMGQLRDAGFTQLRVVMDPTMRAGAFNNWYNLDLGATGEGTWADCFPTADGTYRPFLPCAARRPEYRAAFSKPGVDTIAITTLDNAVLTSGRRDWTDPAALDDDVIAARVYEEYYGLARELLQTYQGTGKRFVLLNWESDNTLVCTVSEYVTDPGARAACDMAAVNPTARVEFFVKWFSLRKAAIAQAQAEAAMAGVTGVSVHGGLEIATYRLLHNQGWTSMIRCVVPRLGLTADDVVSYSAWESVNRGRLDEDLRELKALVQPAQLILGEFGYQNVSDPAQPSNVWRMVEATRAAQRQGIATAFLWNGFFNTDNRDGLLHTDGSETSAMHHLRAAMAPAPTPVGSARILGARELGPNSGGTGRRAVELYGVYPGLASGTYVAQASCEGAPYATVPIIGSALSSGDHGQINVALDAQWLDAQPQRAAERWCTFRVAPAAESQHAAWSATIGPRRLCSGEVCPTSYPNPFPDDPVPLPPGWGTCPTAATP
jgi:hypothetical protein